MPLAPRIATVRGFTTQASARFCIVRTRSSACNTAWATFSAWIDRMQTPGAPGSAFRQRSCNSVMQQGSLPCKGRPPSAPCQKRLGSVGPNSVTAGVPTADATWATPVSADTTTSHNATVAASSRILTSPSHRAEAGPAARTKVCARPANAGPAETSIGRPTSRLRRCASTANRSTGHR